jgi:cell division septal protein FtsQ
MRFLKGRFEFGRWRWQGFKQRLLEWLSILAAGALVVVPLGMLAWLVFFTDTFSVDGITVVDARDHTADEVRALAQDEVGQNILFAQTPVLQERILGEVPQIRDVRIERKLPSTLKIVVQEKTPALLLLSAGKYYFVDRGGIAFEVARLDTLPGTVLPIVKNNDVTADVTLGRPVVEQTFVDFVQLAQDKLPDIVGAEIAEVRMPSLAAREVHYVLETNKLIRFDISRGLDTQLDVLQRLLENNIAEEDLPRVEYIDLRIANRVYYKLR